MDNHEDFLEKFVVLIPVYNEQNTIVKLSQDLDKLQIPYMFIDDGSTDKTLPTLWMKDIPALAYFPNKGKGHAIKIGARYLIEMGYEWILIMDGDGQCAVEDIEKFDYALLFGDESTRIFIGNRMTNSKAMPKIRYLANKYSSLVLSKLANLSIPDTQCGFRLIHKSVFENLSLKGERFDMESEILVKAGQAGMKVTSVPIQCIYDKKRQSKFRPLRDGLRFLRLIFSLKFRLYK
jgi:glycosyltransferase involved in cell wall biosynthesis